MNHGALDLVDGGTATGRRQFHFAAHVGRVGALAVALGVGFASASQIPSAYADPADIDAPSSQEPTSSEPATAAQSATPGPSSSPGVSVGQDSQEPDPASTGSGEESPSHTSTEVAPGVVVSSSGGAHTSSTTDSPASETPSSNRKSKPKPKTKATSTEPVRRVAAHEQAVDTPGSGPTTTATAPDDSPAVAATPTALVAGTPSATPAQARPVSPVKPAALSTPANTAASLLAALSSAMFGSHPGGPVESPLSWMVLAAARRFGAPPDAAVANRAAVVTTAAATATNLEPAVGTPIIGAPDPTTGAVSGQVIAADPEGKSLSYTLKTGPAAGTLSLNKTLGSFTYTPTTSQRVLAQLTAGVDANQFTVTVSDGTNKVDAVVTVAIAPVPVANLGQVAAGNGATGFAVTNTHAYVANRSDNTVTVVDTVSRAVIANITVGSHPSNVTVTPDGKRVYVTNLDSNSVSVIDTATNTKIADVTVGANPYGIAVSPDGKTVYVTNRGAGTVSKISTATNKVTGTVTNVGEIPSTIVVTPDGKKIFVVNTAADYVSVFPSTATKATILPTETGHLASAVAVNPDGTKLYVAGYSDGKVTVFDTKTYAVVDQFTMGGKPGGMAFSKDGSLLLVVNNDGTVQVRDAATKTVLTTVAVSGTTLGGEGAVPRIGVSPDGMQAYVSDATGRVLRVLSLVPPNTRPVAGSPSLDPADPVTGAVRGVITASDADQDKLVYTAGPTLKGKLTLNADGTFTYVPTAAARHAAAASGATAADRSESFTITVSDGRRGVVDVPVSIAISPINTNPTVKLAVGKPNSSTGVVTGTLTGIDADKDVLFYTAPITTAKGTVTVDAKGKITFTPNVAARHAAAALDATETTKTDTFTVTVGDAHGGAVSVPVTVAITPANAKPASTTSVAAQADLTSGVVTGTVKAIDADGDTLTFSAPITTKKGSVVVNANGSFTYTPNATALAAAQATGASAATKTDTFTVSVADGYGGVSTATISVRMVPNRAPVIGMPIIGTPNGATGVVTGKVTATDPDGDKLTYSGTGTTSKGAVVVKADGTFTFTPTATARLNAGAGNVTVTDSFTVTVSDGFGGTSTVTVTPTVDPARHIVTGSVAVGGAPSSVVLNRDGTRAYVANYADGTVSVVNTATNTAIGSPIKVGLQPRAMAVSADGTKLYIAGVDAVTYAGKLTVVNAATNRVIGGPIAVGAYPSAVAVSADGARVYVTNAGDNSVTVIDTTTRQAVGSPITVGEFPAGIALSKDGTRAYVTNSFDNTVSVVNTVTRTVVGEPIAMRALPVSVVVSLDDRRVYVGNLNDHSVSVIDTATNTVIGNPITIPNSPTAIAVSADGARIYVTGFDGSVSVINTATNTLIGSPIAVGVGSPGLALAPNGSRAYVVNGSGRLLVISLASTTAAPVAPTLPGTSSTNTSTGAVTGSLGVTDPTKLTYNVAQQGDYGTVTVKSDGTYTYTPSKAVRQYAGTAPITDTVTINATNARGASTPVILTIAVNPVASSTTPTQSAVIKVGDAPYAPFVSPDNSKIYLIHNPVAFGSSSARGSITVIDAKTNKIIGDPITVGYDPRGAAFTPDGRLLFVSDYATNTVSVINTVTNKVVGDPIEVGDGPRQMVASADGQRIYVSNWHYYDAPGSITIIDTATRSVVGGPIEVGLVPEKLILTKDGKRLYAVNMYSGTVSAIDTASRTVIRTVYTAGVGSQNGVLSPDESVLYVGASNNSIATINTTSFAVGQIHLGHPPDKFLINREGTFLYAVNRDGTLSVVDTTSRTVIASGVFGSGIGLPLTADGKRIYIASSADGTLTTFDTTTNTFVGKPLTVGRAPAGMHLSYDGRTLYVADSTGDALYVIDTHTATPALARQAPASTSALYHRLRELTDWPISREGLAFEKVVGTGQQTRLIVYLGGTVPDDITAKRNIPRNYWVYGHTIDDDINKAIIAEIASMPQGANTEIMLVGYSQGGLDAQNIARLWAAGGRPGKVTTVITFGSPINAPPVTNQNSFHTMHFRADGDPIPLFDVLQGGIWTRDSDTAGQIFEVDSHSNKTDLALHADPQTYVNVGLQFDDPTVSSTWFDLIKNDLKKFRGTIA